MLQFVSSQRDVMSEATSFTNDSLAPSGQNTTADYHSIANVILRKNSTLRFVNEKIRCFNLYLSQRDVMSEATNFTNDSLAP